MTTEEVDTFFDVAVDGILPGQGDLTLTYSSRIPAERGQLVWVPVRKQIALGCVVNIHNQQPEFETRQVLDIVPGFQMSDEQIEIAEWLARQCASDLFSCLALMLPPGVRLTATPWFDLVRRPTTGATRLQEQILEHLKRNGSASLEQLQQAHGSSLSTVLPELERMGAITRRYIADVHTVQLRTETWWTVGKTEGLRFTPRQNDLASVVAAAGPAGIRATEARDRSGVSQSIATKLVAEGAIVAEARPFQPEIEIEPVGTIPQLTPEQASAWQGISQAMEVGSTVPQLLFGVTGSGKTELYLRAIARTLREGKQAIYLVPEIALTTHIVGRVRERFPGQVALLHSGLAAGVRQDAWDDIASGQRRIVVGTRSALMVSVPQLGLIVIDEEHDTSYKQDVTPRYDVRKLAEQLAIRTGATLILGSATPRIETLWRAEQGQIEHYRLSTRAVSTAKSLPPVQIVDTRHELHAGHTGLLSRPLEAAIERAIDRREQTMLMLNRRGTSTIVICRDCGTAVSCPNCDIPLVFHRDRGALICHRCDHRERPHTNCHRCDGPLDYFGAGTQRVEADVRKRFPGARVVRWDQDTSRKRGANAAILKAIEAREVDIIVGTQMLAKGLDLPYVTTVGIVSADVGLHFPDFRAGERTFQLLTQMAGRAGRRTPSSAVIVQTYSPNHYVLQAARTHDVEQFYRSEIAFREQHRYPPFFRLVRYLVRGDTDEECAIASDQMVRQLGRIARESGIEIEIVGPAPAFVARIRNQQQWHIIAKTPADQFEPLLDRLPNPPGWVVDVDPVSLL